MTCVLPALSLAQNLKDIGDQWLNHLMNKLIKGREKEEMKERGRQGREGGRRKEYARLIKMQSIVNE